EYVILTDKYDLWAVKPDGTDAKRLTKGKESNHSYTIDQNDFIDDFYKLSYSGSRISKLLNQEAFLVKVTDRNSFKTGLAIVGINKDPDLLFMEDKLVSKQFLLPDNEGIIY